MISISQLHRYFISTGKVSTDSRNCPKGCIFFALRGESFDGNKFATTALDNGAAYAVIDNENYNISDNYILVNNALETLQNLATYHRQQFHIPVLGITGTNGKTTTKELIASVLQTCFVTHYTQGNFNNHIGVPLTLLQLTNEHEIAIIEMGANHIGEIEALCHIAQPTHGIITNVGKAHLEGFGSFEGIIKTKTELYQFLKNNNGIIFSNSDNNYLWPLSDPELRIPYSTKGFSNASTKILSELPFLEIELCEPDKSWLISSQLTGSYNYENILAALAIGNYFKIPFAKLTEGIEAYIPSNNRSQVKKTIKNTLLLDAYNANPSSMEVAIINFSHQQHPNKQIILGDMKELGNYALEEHIKVAKLACNGDFNKVWFVGEEFNKVIPHLKNTENCMFFKSTEDISSYLQTTTIENSFILIKGSRGMKLENLEQYF